MARTKIAPDSSIAVKKFNAGRKKRALFKTAMTKKKRPLPFPFAKEA